MPLVVSMTARCDFIGCEAEDVVEVELTPGLNVNEYGSPTAIKGILMKLPSQWTSGTFRGIYCPVHPNGVTLDGVAAIDEERAAFAVECPGCGAPIGSPCRHGDDLVATHRSRHQKAARG